MNRDELKSAIVISDRLGAVKGYAEHAWCVVQSDDATWGGFPGERGNMAELERFSCEHQACACLLGRLTYSQILAGLTWTDEQQPV